MQVLAVGPGTVGVVAVGPMAVGIFGVGQHATGFIAIGQIATGFFALGQVSTGVVAVGQLARGVFVAGQLAIGLVAVGQVALGVLWTGGIGIGATRWFGLVYGLFPASAVRDGQQWLRWRWNRLRRVPDDRPIGTPLPAWRIPVAVVGTAVLVTVWWFVAGRAMQGILWAPPD
ncbi:hypothetical protein [Nocardia sp. alder85J]|uniref:hypothetical protein n=1 Tax=Nocardia sp. alder85J TaxID=2862949 RepID=UPI001CD321A0|nr:hypothetical protein [Nocardia sp. alder85J]MCX4094600.1 hypothetical protein [Nocardia sp. alder85J]